MPWARTSKNSNSVCAARLFATAELGCPACWPRPRVRRTLSPAPGNPPFVLCQHPQKSLLLPRLRPGRRSAALCPVVAPTVFPPKPRLPPAARGCSSSRSDCCTCGLPYILSGTISTSDFIIVLIVPYSNSFPIIDPTRFLTRGHWYRDLCGIQAEARVNKPRARAQGPAKAQKSAFSSSIPRKPAEEEKLLWQRQRQSDRGKQIGRARRQLKQ